jgi:hypothetical protein
MDQSIDRPTVNEARLTLVWSGQVGGSLTVSAPGSRKQKQQLPADGGVGSVIHSEGARLPQAAGLGRACSRKVDPAAHWSLPK